MELIGLFSGKIKVLVFLLFLPALLLSQTLLNNYPQSAAEQSISPWLAQEHPVLKTLSEVSYEQIPQAVYGSQECQHYEKFILKPYKKAGPLNPIGQDESSFLACGMDTQFGTMNNNYLMRSGSNIAGFIYDETGVKINRISGIPNSNHGFIGDTSAPRGSYLDISRDIGQRLVTNVDKKTGGVKHILSPGTKHRVKDENGNSLAFYYVNGGFSANGKWRVSETSAGIVRLDIETGSVLIFAPGYRHDIGVDPTLHMSITNDGRYAAVMAGSYGTFRIYDLNTCVKSATLNKPASCQSRDLTKPIKDTLPDHSGTGVVISFTDNYTLKFYGSANKDGVIKRYSHLLTAYGQSPVEFPYLALGDSFSSGEGANSYKAGTDVKSPLNKCHLSLNSYPFLIARDLGIQKYESIACSGAKIKDINFDFYSNETNELNKTYREKESQAKGLENIVDDYIVSNFLPGYRTQYKFVEKYRPSKITLSISGNDIGFVGIVERCVAGIDDCYSKTEERVKLVDTINQRFKELSDLLGQLSRSSPETNIYVIGYPRMVDLNGSCGNNVRISQSERVFFNDLTNYLNSVIKKAADKSGAFYVDVSDALENNQLCEGGNEEMAVNGLTAGNDTWLNIGPIGKESYHPNALGHSLLRNKVLEKTNNFTAPNPGPNGYIQDPQRSDAADFIGSTNFDAFDLSYVRLTNLTDGLWYKNETQTVTAEGFAPNSQISGFVYSEPTSIGVFVANENGEISETINVPSSLPPGYHTLILSGENESGEKIEFQQQIYIAASAEDIDGNGVNDTNEQCPGIGATGVDYDQDGVDDACDGYIGEPPVENDGLISLPDIINTPEESGSEDPDDGDDDIISGVNPTNTNGAQGQQNGSNLQSSGTQAQATAGGLQSGSASSIYSNEGNSLEYLSNSTSSQSLSVGVASSSTGGAATPAPPKDAGLNMWIFIIPLLVILAVFLILKSRRDEEPDTENVSVPISEITSKPKKDKKHKKKKKKPNHH